MVDPAPPSFTFDPRGIVGVVTGGGSGIGRALASALLARGADVVAVTDLDADQAHRVAAALNDSGARGRAVAMRLDVADGASVEALAGRLVAEFGRIDLWCSNAGINVGSGLGDPGDWERSFAVNVMGHVNAARCVIPAMKSRGRGFFVVTASAGLLSDLRVAPYTASKHAAVALAEWLAITCRGDGVSVHCVCPEGVKTAMTRASSEQAAKGMTFLEADDVAGFVLDRMAEGEFLILPHPRVAEFEVRRATDRGRWIDSMHKAFSRMPSGRPPASS